MKLLFLLSLVFLVSCATTKNNYVSHSDIHFELGAEVMGPYGYRDLKKRTWVHKFRGDLTKYKTSVSYNTLAPLLNDVHDRFVFVDDIKQYKQTDYWLTMREIPDGEFKGDCEDFAQAIRKILLENNIIGNLVFCKTEDGEFHMVVVVDTWILDNRKTVPTQKYSIDDDYTFISMLTPDGKWKMIYDDLF